MTTRWSTAGTVLAFAMAGAVACSKSDSSGDLQRPVTPDPTNDSGSSGNTPDGSGPTADAAPPAPPPTPSGCITDVTPGDHTFTCEGFSTDVSIPTACVQPGCGLITEIHGDTGNGALMDANTNLKALGKQRGYVVVAPTGPPWPGGPGSTWSVADDETVIKIIKKVAEVFRTDPKKNHVTGFSRGGFVAWRLLCKHAELFASVAPGTAGSAPGGACSGVSEVSCPFDASQKDGMPSAEVPILFLMGRTDTPCLWAARSASAIRPSRPGISPRRAPSTVMRNTRIPDGPTRRARSSRRTSTRTRRSRPARGPARRGTVFPGAPWIHKLLSTRFRASCRMPSRGASRS